MQQKKYKMEDNYIHDDALKPYQIKYVVYHAHCVDGLTAAAIAYDWDRMTKNYEYIPMTAGDLPAKVLEIKNSNILFADVAPKKEEYDQIIVNGNKVLIMDHHEPAMKELASVPTEQKFYIGNASGAMLAYIYFHMKCSPSYRDLIREYREHDDSLMQYFHLKDMSEYKDWKEKMYNFVAMIQEHDLPGLKPDEMFSIGIYVEGDSKALFSGLTNRINHIKDDSNIKIPIVAGFMFNYKELIDEGLSLKEADDAYIKLVASKAEIVEHQGVKSARVNADSWKLCGEVGMYLLEIYPEIQYTMLLYPSTDSEGNPNYRGSLRSRKGETDCVKIAEKYGGKGHVNAAGFDMKTFEEIIAKFYE